MKKLPAWTHHFVLPLLISFFMSGIVSAIATVRTVGMNGLGDVWLGSWLWSWMVAYPAILVVMPIARRLVSRIVEEPSSSK